MTLSFDPHDPEYQADPYPALRRLREEDPVHLYLEGEERIWVLTLHEDGVSALRDARFSAAKFPEPMLRAVAEQPDSPMASVARMVLNMMLVKDPPDHTRLRNLVNTAFTPRVVERLRPRVQQIADDLIERVQADGRMDLIADFAAPLPIVVIAELLGVPVEDQGRLKAWSDDLVTFLDGTIRDAGLERAASAVREIRPYFEEIVAQRRARPREDLISGLIAAQAEGDRLDDDELYATLTLLLGAGHETTTNLIGNGVDMLLSHPDQLEKLRAMPELAKPAVEEVLRYASPVQMTSRTPLEDVVIRGRHVRAGEEVNVSIAGANRDPAVFTDPERFDVARADNRHLSFGFGAHFCVGAALARLEGQIALQTLGKRLPGMRREPGTRTWKPGIVMRALRTLPVRF